MSTVSALQADLERDECLLANGFVFATGEIVVLTTDAKISKRMARDADLEQELGFASIATFCSASSDEWEARAGETSAEGEGYIALFRAGSRSGLSRWSAAFHRARWSNHQGGFRRLSFAHALDDPDRKPAFARDEEVLTVRFDVFKAQSRLVGDASRQSGSARVEP